MGTNNLEEIVSGTIKPEHINQSRDAFIGDIVPRNVDGEPEARAGKAGTDVLPFEEVNADRFISTGTVKSSGTVDLSAGESFFNTSNFATATSIATEDTVVVSLDAPGLVMVYLSTVSACSANSIYMMLAPLLATTFDTTVGSIQMLVNTTARAKAVTAIFNLPAGLSNIYLQSLAIIGASTANNIQYGVRLL